MITIQNDKPYDAKLIMRYTEDVSVTCFSRQSTPLHPAAERAKEDLLCKGADKNSQDERGYTPLMCAVLNSEMGAVYALMEDPMPELSIIKRMVYQP